MIRFREDQIPDHLKPQMTYRSRYRGGSRYENEKWADCPSCGARVPVNTRCEACGQEPGQ